MVAKQNLEEITKEIVAIHKKLNSLIMALNDQIKKQGEMEKAIEKFREQREQVSKELNELEKSLL